jgi:D-alanyl-D-alanine carboxypeptidase (penicillin-binding protein 5/6)
MSIRPVLLACLLALAVVAAPTEAAQSRTAKHATAAKPTARRAAAPKAVAKPKAAAKSAVQLSSAPSVVPGVPAPPPVDARGFLLIDASNGQTLAELNADARMEPASITKLMTAYIVFVALKEKRLSLTDQIKVSEHAWRTGGAVTDGSTSFLEINSEVPVEALIQGMIVQSGNDATIALAEKLGGTEDAFVQMMNDYAKRLGLKGTHYVNSWGGPDPEHYSTPRDIAILGSALIRDFPEDYKWYSQREFTWNNHKQQNRNGLLGRDPSVDGMKTGHTESAGYCLVTSAKRDNTRLLSVVLGSSGIRAREDASAALLTYGYTYFETLNIKKAGETVLKPRVYKSAGTYAAIAPATDVQITIPRGQSGGITTTASVRDKLIAPLPANVAVGEMQISLAGKEVARVPLYPQAAVAEGGLWTRASDTVSLWFK